MKINIDKCFHIHFNGKIDRNTSRKYFLDSIEITSKNSVSDLGLLVSSNLDFTNHISSIIVKARQRSGTFFRGFITRKLSFVRKIFVTYIRPCLEYNTNIWNPTKIYLIDRLESVQRHFTKKFPPLVILRTLNVLKP